jgi:hypothetical protein
MVSGSLVAEGPPIRPLSSFSSAERFAAMRTWLQCSSIRRDMCPATAISVASDAPASAISVMERAAFDTMRFEDSY